MTELAGADLSGAEILDNTHGKGVAHDCPGVWTFLGENPGGHELLLCRSGKHVLIAWHRSARHKCISVICGALTRQQAESALGGKCSVDYLADLANNQR